MTNGIKMSALSVALAVFALPVVAQSTDASAQASAGASAPVAQGSASAGANAQVAGKTIHQRKAHQQDRIANGVASGQLTAGEAAHLEHNQARINQQIRADPKANGGTLTAQERTQINREQNRQSRQIYRAKHNNRHQ